MTAEWKRKMRVNGGGRMELWSRYFHQMLALNEKYKIYHGMEIQNLMISKSKDRWTNIENLKNFH